jgi:hypothetical protein
MPWATALYRTDQADSTIRFRDSTQTAQFKSSVTLPDRYSSVKEFHFGQAWMK